MGYPTVVAFSPSKKKYAIMKTVINEGSLGKFIDGLFDGQEGLYDIKEDLKIRVTGKWSGKDESPEETDKIDL